MSKRVPLVLLKRSVTVGDIVLPSKEQDHRLRRVLRLSDGDHVRGMCPNGFHADLIFRRDKTGRVSLQTVDVVEKESDGTHGLTIALSLIKRASYLDFTIEKGTEIGVSGWWSVQTSRCADSGLLRSYGRRLQRWERVVESAVRQSARRSIPVVEGVFGWEEFIQASRAFPFRAFGHPSVPDRDRRPVWNRSLGPALFAVGPEGGFSHSELRSLREAGFCEFWLGPSVLRTETAAIVAAVLLLV